MKGHLSGGTQAGPGPEEEGRLLEEERSKLQSLAVASQEDHARAPLTPGHQVRQLRWHSPLTCIGLGGAALRRVRPPQETGSVGHTAVAGGGWAAHSSPNTAKATS